MTERECRCAEVTARQLAEQDARRPRPTSWNARWPLAVTGGRTVELSFRPSGIRTLGLTREAL